MPSRLFLWALTSALAGFLFGFDTVVISGAEQTIQELWGLSPAMHGFALASALYGTMLGALFGGWPADRFGRKNTLLYIGVLYFISAIGSALANDVMTFIVARFIGGIGIGVCTVASPLYVSEISPPERRGRLTALFQFNIVLGILIAFASNALLAGIGDTAWRWMLGVEAIPALLYTAMTFFIPESPRWLITNKGDRAGGIKVLRDVSPASNETALNQLADEITAAASQKENESGFWSRVHLKPILLAFLVAFFNQLSGINAILYFAPRIFEMTGLGQQAALLQSVGIGVANLIFTLLGVWLIDRVGRRTLLYVGSYGYIISLGACAWAFHAELYGIVPWCIFLFIAAHAIGQGAVIWVLISEVFPNRFRAKGQALGSFTHWIFAALLTTLFPSMVVHFSASTVFMFFCIMMVFQLIWVKVMVPETKGVSLEELQRQLSK